MTDGDDRGVLLALVEHFNRELLPRALEIERQLGAGEKLSESALEHISEVLARIREITPLLERHPEYHRLAAGVISLYAELARRAWQTESGEPKDVPGCDRSEAVR